MHDSFNGDLTLVHDSIELNQFTFLYLYADWCARSKKYKDLISQIAEHHSDRIKFIAVNCFVGNCQKTFNLVKYPQILVQTRDVGLYFYKGPFEYSYIVNYLSLIQTPLQRIDDLDEFIHFVINNDVNISF